MISVLLPIICLVAFQLMSIKDDSIHYLLCIDAPHIMCGGLAHIVRRLNTDGAEYDNYNYTYLFLEVFTIYSNFIHTKTAYTLRASCDIITALRPAVSVRKRLLPSVTLSKPCVKA